MSTLAVTILIQIDLPEATLRFSEGYIRYEGQAFRAKDPVFGTIAGGEELDEGVGTKLPALDMTLIPPSSTAAADLAKPGHQTSRVRYWVAEYDPKTGEVIDADVQFDGQLDQSELSYENGARDLTMLIVSLIERLFEGNIGNSMTPTWHKSVWDGEEGHDHATGLVLEDAWGVESARSGSSGAYGSGGGGGTGPLNPGRNLRQW